MFGSLRLLLALLVVLSHLPGSDYFVHFGFYAVRGFFVISGFVITAGLHDAYDFDTKRFWLNRLLRLLPPFYLVCLVTLLIISAFPAEAEAYLSSWISQSPVYDVMVNLVVLPLQFPETEFRLVPPYWSVAVELQMYALLFIAAARSEQLALTTLCLGVVYHLACIYNGLDFGSRYFAAPSATLSFAAGAVIYFWVKRGVLDVVPSAVGLAFTMWLANIVAARSVLPDEYAFGPGYYFATFLFVMVVAGLAKVQWTPLAKQIDRLLGEIAYPVFLVQWLGGFIAALIISPGTWRGWTVTLVSLPLIIGMAVALAWLNRKFIEPTRVLIRTMSLGGTGSTRVASQVKGPAQVH